ncbi:glycosyltransferase [Chlorogloeopsis sp. ULAP01]|uniref:glycosyltransferase n=1 Tax=Chlorogloeopsis sp. ULAP01 TaxID=3056483 RepID=UPI0025AAACA4|nr:glycosyltransferase [Chlorogloeopsis sp. ULAP01]MDM9384587.1 glycosyltransferase [Chlorogloeopsis sp. ULAP01]
MTHFGILCPAKTGHLNTMLPLGRELQRRGHRVTLFGIADVQSKTLAAGLNFWRIGETDYPLGIAAQSLTQLGNLSGFAALRYNLNLIQKEAAMVLRDAPKALKNAGVEALLVNQMTLEGGSVAEFLDLPFITVCSALPVNQEDGVPPFVTSWSYNSAQWAHLRNRAAYSLLNHIAQPIQKLINEYRQSWNLPPCDRVNDSCSKLAQLSQIPAEFDFPRQHLPQCFHFTGPYHESASREAVPFPWEKLTGQLLIYASMGTIQNRLMNVFHCIAEACDGLNVQLVISLGGSNPDYLKGLPGKPLVVKYAPQMELLQKATLTITHAGLNTVLESLNNAVPMVAIPITSDQPGTAARLAWTGAGVKVPLARLSIPKLRTCIQEVLSQDSYKNNASRLQAAIQRAGGVRRAADIVELAISKQKPVVAAV